MTLEDALEDLAAECERDHVGLWEVIDAAQSDLGATNAEETRALTLRLARLLLERSGMQVGFPTPDGRGFVPWDLSPDQAVARIDAEWSALGREPNIGDVAWFTTGSDAPSRPPQPTA